MFIYIFTFLSSRGRRMLSSSSLLSNGGSGRLLRSSLLFSCSCCWFIIRRTGITIIRRRTGIIITRLPGAGQGPARASTTNSFFINISGLGVFSWLLILARKLIESLGSDLSLSRRAMSTSSHADTRRCGFFSLLLFLLFISISFISIITVIINSLSFKQIFIVKFDFLERNTCFGSNHSIHLLFGGQCVIRVLSNTMALGGHKISQTGLELQHPLLMIPLIIKFHDCTSTNGAKKLINSFTAPSRQSNSGIFLTALFLLFEQLNQLAIMVDTIILADFIPVETRNSFQGSFKIVKCPSGRIRTDNIWRNGGRTHVFDGFKQLGGRVVVLIHFLIFGFFEHAVNIAKVSEENTVKREKRKGAAESRIVRANEPGIALVWSSNRTSRRKQHDCHLFFRQTFIFSDSGSGSTFLARGASSLHKNRHSKT